MAAAPGRAQTRRPLGALLLRLWALAAPRLASGARLATRGGASAGPEGDGVVLDGGVLAARLPARLDFASPRPEPLARVRLDAAGLEPEGGRDAQLVLGVDSAQRLRLRRWQGGGAPAAADGGLPLAWVKYSNTVAQNGWAHLSVTATSDPRASDDLKVYAAGWLEGFASARQIRDFQHNAGALIEKDEANTQALDNIKDLFAKEIHTICTRAGVEANGTAPPRSASQADPWWQHARLMLMQAWGMLDAFNLNVDRVNGTPMSMVDLFVLNSDGETPELEKAYDFQEMALRQSIRECGGDADCDEGAEDNSSTEGGVGGSPGGAPAALLQERQRATARQRLTPDVADEAYHFEEAILRQGEARDCDEGGDCDDDDNATDAGAGQDLADGGRGAVLLQRRRLRAARRPERGGLLARVRAQRERTRRAWSDRTWRKFRRSYGRCSALVRLAPNASDILVGHTTFSDYSEMNRIFKHYDFPLRGIASRRMSFSSYPGVMGSTDDFYIMGTGLVVTETTVSMLSDEAFDRLDDNGTTVPDYMRIMLANRLARTGQEWVELMTQSATGTYNSQWMVVDYKAFQPGRDLYNGTLWVLEQAPGVSHSQDMTAHLRRAGFWASANRAFFGDVRAASGEAEAEGLHGRLFSESRNPRANIFAKTAPQVATLADMRAEMQRNRWPHEVDGGPDNTPDHAVAARGDLGRDPVPNGAVDAKVTSACLAKELAADAISGPAHDGLPPFRWNDAHGQPLYPGYPRDGLPDAWDFGWVRMTPGGEAAATEACRTPPR